MPLLYNLKYAHLLQTLPNRLHDPIEVSRQQLQAARVEQQSALAACLRARRARCIVVLMRELLVSSKCRNVVLRKIESIDGYGGGYRRLLW